MNPEPRVQLAHSEANSLAQWVTEHFKTCTKGEIVLKVGGCAIGSTLYVECTCGLNRDITDYSLW